MESNISNAFLGKKKITRLDTPVNIFVHSKRYKNTDPDGISIKAVLDGIVLAGILPNDTAKEIKGIFYTQEKIPRNEQEETIITIKTID